MVKSRASGAGCRMSVIADELARLEEIVRRLEADDLELDAALALFEEGVSGFVRRGNVSPLRSCRYRRSRGGGRRSQDHQTRCLTRRRRRRTICWPRRETGATRLLSQWADRLGSEVGGRTGAALAYALRTPGKRVRPRSSSPPIDRRGGASPAIVGVAAAVETVHAYSLVHDDLPCMDDDDLRRGRPTTHRQFDVPTATRVGWLLVPVAARELAAAAEEMGSPATLGHMAETLFQAGGIEGWSAGSGSTSRPSAEASLSRS